MLVLDQVRDLERRVVSRLRELEPLMREYEQLRKAAQRLGVKYTPRADRAPSEQRPASRRRTSQATTQATPERAAGTATARRATRAAKTTARARPGTTPRQRPPRRRAAASPGQRQQEVLRVVGESPGITVAEIGRRLGVDSTGLYRIVRRLTEDGRLRKEGTQLHPVESAKTAVPAESTASAAAPSGPGTRTDSEAAEADK